MDRLQALKVFVAVAEAEGFARGARAAGISPPSATRAINTLEQTLGARLFTRSTRRVRLTDAGRAYLEDVREILTQLQAADDAASGAANTPVGQLRLTCPQEFGRIHVAPVLTDFLDAHPQVRADVLMVDRLVNLLEEGFDIAVRIGHLPSSDLTAIRIGQVRQVVCGSLAYFAERGLPQTPDDLTAHRLVAIGPASPLNEWRFGADRSQAVRVTPQLTVSSLAAAIDIARRGWGLCRVLSYQVGADLASGTLDTVLEAYEPAPLPIHLVHVEGRRAAARVRAFIDFATPRLREIEALHYGQSAGPLR
ncbi:LysR family transcriptional regulator [Kushneria phosphatilytica]|uniref:LysR family transcriptional regulator n=1 Tax=Kushneria phosphatilytica TaxID=657387 RepID=A0A1S1P044_9GAMM|nr:LysR family transcriptional regulator [Kushneria phosphatilytica]OHV13900.1 LysR family transcriptional regulator [Kushneria phosphatilytica]QEL10461.1 LysR family transcriptional regulator [Kushneria phosphatilytica]